MVEETSVLRIKAVIPRQLRLPIIGLLGAGLLVFGLALGGVFASEPANTIVVSRAGDGDYVTISDAVANAPAGSRIAIRPGHYREGFTLDKRMEVIGVATDKSVLGKIRRWIGLGSKTEPVVIEASEGACALVKADGVALHGLVLRCMAGRNNRDHPAVTILGRGVLLEGCEISSDSSSGVAVYGEEAAATVRGCKIHGSNLNGILVSQGARLALEETEIFGNKGSGVEIGEGGDATIKKCKVYDQALHGIYINKSGKGIVEDSDINDNGGDGVMIVENGRGSLVRCKLRGGGKNGIEISDISDAEVRECAIFDNAGNGIIITQSSSAAVTDSEIHSNKHSGIEIRTGSNPTVQRCKIQDGMVVADQGAGIIEDCDFFKTIGNVIEVKDGGSPTIRRCKIREGWKAGIYFGKAGLGTVEDCEVVANRGNGIGIGEGGDPVIRRCRINGNWEPGVRVFPGGAGRVEDCDLTENARGAWQLEDAANLQRMGNVE